jgi:phosphate transport system protein
MPSGFADQLDRLEHRVLQALGEAVNTLVTVAAAIEDRTDQRIEVIVGDARKLRAKAGSADADLVIFTARQTPVASDLRLVLALIELSQHAVLIANQFDLMSQQLAEINPAAIDRESSKARLVRMAEDASAQLRKATNAFRYRDLASARELDRDDDVLDTLNLEVANAATRVEFSPEGRALGFHHVLIARSLERIGDNAVDIAEQVAFLMTAELREFSDASEPRARSKNPRRGAQSEDLS